VRDGAVDLVLACHLLDLVPDRATAIRELGRVLAPGGRCVAVTNGAQHIRALRDLVEQAVSNPEWRLRVSAGAFTAENGAGQLTAAFGAVTRVRPDPVHPVIIRDAAVAADYVASIADHYQDEVDRPWADVVEDVRGQVQAVISARGAFTTAGDVAAFICE
jgi:SAM-dependent methyltransferase